MSAMGAHIGEPDVGARRLTGMSASVRFRAVAVKAVVAAVVGALALGGCARTVVHSSARELPGVSPSTTAGSPPSAAGGSAPGGSAAPGGVTGLGTLPKTVALVEADRILGAFPAPLGAQPLTKAPATPGAPALGLPGTPNIVARTAWWRVPSTPQAVLAALSANPPSGSTAAGSTGSYGLAFTWPAVPGVLADRQMQIDVTRSGKDTIVRVDAVVTYLDARPASTLIPDTAKAAVVVLDNRGPGVVTEKDEYGPVTITDPTRLGALIKLLNSASMQLPAVRHCPNLSNGGGGMRLDFRAAPTGPSVAVVSITTSGCPSMTVKPTGAPPATLDGGPDTVILIEQLLSLPWPHP